MCVLVFPSEIPTISHDPKDTIAEKHSSGCLLDCTRLAKNFKFSCNILRFKGQGNVVVKVFTRR